MALPLLWRRPSSPLSSPSSSVFPAAKATKAALFLLLRLACTKTFPSVGVMGAPSRPFLQQKHRQYRVRGGSQHPAARGRSAGEVDLGTTLVAIKYDGGVVVGADSRTSISGYVSHRFADKIAPVAPRCLVCRSGSAADTQQLAYAARRVFERRELRYGGSATVSQVAHWIKSALYGGSRSASLLVAGYDVNEKGGEPRIYTVLANGALLEEADERCSYAAAGSGSTYVLGYLDHYVASNGGSNGGDARTLSEDDAVRICSGAIQLAIARDGSSGGAVRVYVCDRRGIREVAVPQPSSSPPAGATTGTVPSFSGDHEDGKKKDETKTTVVSAALKGFAAPESYDILERRGSSSRKE